MRLGALGSHKTLVEGVSPPGDASFFKSYVYYQQGSTVYERKSGEPHLARTLPSILSSRGPR